MSKPETVESHIANAPTEAQPILEELRERVTSTVPEAEEGIRYNVPFYEFDGTHVGFTAFKNQATFGIGAGETGIIGRLVVLCSPCWASDSPAKGGDTDSAGGKGRYLGMDGPQLTGPGERIVDATAPSTLVLPRSRRGRV